MAKVGVLIPTIFSRPQYLPSAARSIKASGDCYLLLSSPKPSPEQLQILDTLIAEGTLDATIVEDAQPCLALKINEGLRKLPKECEFIGWLGDDDVLQPKMLEVASLALEKNPDAAMVYGGCDYISSTEEILFTNRSSQFHVSLLRFGPQLIPQPGSLWRRDAFEKVGGLSGEFDLAFDFDLFLKLSKVGRLIHIPQTLAQFRWHPDSLSVKKRMTSALEASKVRRKHYTGAMRILWPLWEPWVIAATWLAGKLVSLRFRY